MQLARRRALPVLALLALAAAGCGREDPAVELPGPECRIDGDCPGPSSPCLVAACVARRCETAPLAAGSVLADADAGDCNRSVCDGEGNVVPEADGTDLPVDGNACTQDRCSGGVASNPAEEAGAACAQDGGSLCDGAGACVQCLTAADCPGSDTECSARTCTGGICGVTFASLGTALAEQASGDCRTAVCDGVGGTTTTPLDADVPVDGNACTADLCTSGVASNPPTDAGTACAGANGAVVCDGAGTCVECLTRDTCPGTDGECQFRTCIAGACGTGYAADGTPLASQTAGDCRQQVCDGAGGTQVAALATDVPRDGDDCTDDLCDGTTPSNPVSAAGTACAQSGGAVCDGAGACVECNAGADCASGVCSGAHVCQAPSCDDGVKNGAETDVDCGGGTCAACDPPEACLVASDCSSGVCTSLRCAAPSCTDGLPNGTETDVDCGGACLADCARGKACLASTDCQSANCVDGLCAGPLVTASIPADGATGVVPASAITLTLGKPLLFGSATAQATSGPCSGTVQISADGFTTCIGVSSRTDASYTVVLQPAARLEPSRTYRIRTTAGVDSYSTAIGAFEPFETPDGFTVAGGGACAGAVVVSQIYAHGGLSGARWASDFVELHNNGPTPASLDGLSVQYTSATGYTWTVTPLAGTVPAGGYFLVREAGGATGAALPAPDAVGTIPLSPTGGKVALVSSRVALTTGCPPPGDLRVLDLVGYGAYNGTPASCSEGPSGPAAAPDDATAALARAGAGCADGNGNAADLASRLAVPRNAASAPMPCGCNGTAVNGTGLTIEMDACSLDTPSLTVAAGTDAGPVDGSVDERDITEYWGPPVALTADLGFGPVGTDPRYAAGWTFVPATWRSQGLTADVFRAFFTAPTAGEWAYVYRFSPDGERWTYCDPDGAGANPAAAFEPNALPTFTVAP